MSSRISSETYVEARTAVVDELADLLFVGDLSYQPAGFEFFVNTHDISSL